MKIQILSACTQSDQWSAISVLTWSINQAWANKHDYEFLYFYLDSNLPRSSSWYKILLMLKALSDKSINLVMWIDADAIILKDFQVEDLNTGSDLRMGVDSNGLNAGIILLRNTDWSVGFLNRVWESESFIHHIWWEQAAIHHLQQMGYLKNHLDPLPPEFNSYEPIKGKTFIAHAAGQEFKYDFLHKAIKCFSVLDK